MPEREPFTIGGMRVAPGERRVVGLAVAELSTHTPITMPVEVVHGHRPGPGLFVCAALHGDEINGVEIIRHLMALDALENIRGTLLAVPIVNAFGFMSGTRYLPDRRDLNRSFPGSPHGPLAFRLAHLFFQEVVARASHGIDLHTGALHRMNLPQVRANLDDAKAEAMALAFRAPVVLDAGFRDKSLRHAAAEHKIPVIVYEAGEALRFDPLSIRIGVRGVLRVMRALGMLAERNRARARPMPAVLRSNTWVRAPRSGVLRSGVKLGRTVKEGDLLGLIGDPYGASTTDVIAHASGLVIGRTNLPLVHEGDALFNLARVEGTRIEALELDAYDTETTPRLANAAS